MAAGGPVYVGEGGRPAAGRAARPRAGPGPTRRGAAGGNRRGDRKGSRRGNASRARPVHPVPEGCRTRFLETGWFKLKQIDRFADKAGYLLSRALMPSVVDWKRFPLPDSLYFLYFLYFLYRPLRLLGLASPSPAGPQHPLNRDAPANHGTPADGVQNATVISCNLLRPGRIPAWQGGTNCSSGFGRSRRYSEGRG